MRVIYRSSLTLSRYIYLFSFVKTPRKFIIVWSFHKAKLVFYSPTNVASVGSVFNDTRKVKVLSLPETIKEKVREPLPFAYSIHHANV